MSSVETYKRQESVLALLNLAVLASLFFVHILFLSVLGRPGWLLLITLAVRFAILIVELVWVQRLTAESEGLITAHIHLSVLINIAFAFLASILSGIPDSHYSVLMIIPIITAAYRFGRLKTMVVVFIAIGLTMLEVWLHFRSSPPVDVSEYFEAATVSLLFLVVAIVVQLLVGDLRREEEKLNESVSELRRLQQRLVEEEKLAAIGQLSSAIAHEIRNPVSMIASSLKMVEGRGPGSEVAREMFSIAATEAKRLETLTGDFLAFARTKEPRMKATPVRASLDYLAGLSKALAEEKGVSIEVEGSDTLEFNMDADQIHQALLNLLTNALRATPRGGRVIIGAGTIDGRPALYVENTGPKIPHEDVSKIFDPFFTSAAKGTGLGLSIVRKIARSHGGEAWLAENEEGRVRFEIRF